MLGAGCQGSNTMSGLYRLIPVVGLVILAAHAAVRVFRTTQPLRSAQKPAPRNAWLACSLSVFRNAVRRRVAGCVGNGVAADETEHEIKTQAAAKAIRHQLEGRGRRGRSDLRRAIYRTHRPYFDDAITALLAG